MQGRLEAARKVHYIRSHAMHRAHKAETRKKWLIARSIQSLASTASFPKHKTPPKERFFISHFLVNTIGATRGSIGRVKPAMFPSASAKKVSGRV